MDNKTKNEKNQEKPSIEPLKNGPYLVRGVEEFRNSKGEKIETQPTMLLCRCGHSSHKPFCDGTHTTFGFLSDKHPDRVPDKMDHYEGKEITIHDNRGVCSHAGHCTDNAPKVFEFNREPWIDPNADDADKTARVIRMCPSGALSYTKGKEEYKDQDRNPAISIRKDGPHQIVGGIELNDPDGNQPESKEHYTLCRCGGSKNKPFCSGAHWYIKFKDEKN